MRYASKLALMLACLMLLSGFAAANADGVNIVKGYVTDCTGEPIEGVEIIATCSCGGTASDTTGTNGYYEITGHNNFISVEVMVPEGYYACGPTSYDGLELCTNYCFKLSECCPRSPGYWKNHEEDWPVDSIVIGGVTYTQEEALAIMNSPVRGDKSITMFKALAAAKLNVAAGCCCYEIDGHKICAFITAADTWMIEHSVGSDVKGLDWNGLKILCTTYTAEDVYEILDEFNNDECDSD